MTNRELIGILAMIKQTRSTKWRMVMEIVKCLNGDKPCRILHQDWADAYRNPLDLNDINTWSTFDETCINLVFFAEDDKLFCDATIWDGDSFGGQRTNVRFTAQLGLPDEFLQVISGLIERDLNEHLEDLYDKHLESQKKHWIAGKRNMIMIGVNTDKKK